MKWWRRQTMIVLAMLLGMSGVAQAEWQQSSNYAVNESELGGSGDFNGASTSYSFAPGVDDGGATLGDTAVGNSTSTSYQSNSGFNTTAQPGLMFTVDTSLVDLGALSATVKKTATATFHVRNYTSYGYVIQIIGSPPSNSGHQLTALTSDTASSAGTEQFGVNTVFNTSAGVGADPVQNPTGFGYGVAGDGSTNNYKQADKWRFNSGETVASAPKSSGNTDYTMTFLANMSTTTPGGKYSGSLTLVATGTY